MTPRKLLALVLVVLVAVLLDPAPHRLTLPTSPAYADPLARLYVLATDAANIPLQATYDEIIVLSDVSTVFLADAMPERRALMVSPQFLDAIVTPIENQPSQEYMALYTILANSHMVFAIDRDVDDIAHQIGFDRYYTSFDPYGRYMPGRALEGSHNLAGAGVYFEYPEEMAQVKEGWHAIQIASPITETLMPPPAEDYTGTLSTMPVPAPYWAIDTELKGHALDGVLAPDSESLDSYCDGKVTGGLLLAERYDIPFMLFNTYSWEEWHDYGGSEWQEWSGSPECCPFLRIRQYIDVYTAPVNCTSGGDVSPDETHGFVVCTHTTTNASSQAPHPMGSLWRYEEGNPRGFPAGARCVVFDWDAPEPPYVRQPASLGGFNCAQESPEDWIAVYLDGLWHEPQELAVDIPALAYGPRTDEPPSGGEIRTPFSFSFALGPIGMGAEGGDTLYSGFGRDVVLTDSDPPSVKWEYSAPELMAWSPPPFPPIDPEEAICTETKPGWTWGNPWKVGPLFHDRQASKDNQWAQGVAFTTLGVASGEVWSIVNTKIPYIRESSMFQGGKRYTAWNEYIDASRCDAWPPVKLTLRRMCLDRGLLLVYPPFPHEPQVP